MGEVNKVKDARSLKEFWESRNFFRRANKEKPGAISVDPWVKYYSDIFPPRTHSVLDLGDLFVEELDSSFFMAEQENTLLT